MLSFDQASLHPLTTDAQVQLRASQLVGRAVRRQLWIMLLDENDVQLPVIVPIDDLPPAPDGDLPFAYIVESTGAAAVFVVLERYGGEELTPADRAWAKHVRDGCAAASVRLRGILLSHRRGVRWMAEDDYLY
jgi:hypothetical protein